MRKIEMFFANGTTIVFNCKTEEEFNMYLDLGKVLSKKDSNNTASMCYAGGKVNEKN